jgi:UDP-N-acetylmuramoyl-L-alanyl-D-glutamate--2,6-diaminopimelate ligase
MTLRDVLTGCRVLRFTGDLETEILGIAHDSREVSSGFLFVAIRGAKVDGNHFAGQAIARGAAAIASAAPPPGSSTLPWIQVEDDRSALATLAANFYGRPTEQLQVVGVTGTNGKTTTTYLLESILKAAGLPAAVFGTIGYRGPGFEYAAERTTPEASDLEVLFKRVVDAGWRHAVMEVSSHAIALKRVEGIHFDVAIFTNLSRDHLDFHGDMASYFLEKKKLFTGLDGVLPRVFVLNSDDAHFEDLQRIDPSRVISYGIETASDVRPLSHHFGWQGTEAVFGTPLGDIEVRSALMGTPNLYNMGAAIGAAIGLGIKPEDIASGIENLPSVPGRFESISTDRPYRIIVDYAHTDDALEKVLKSAREITAGRVIVLFGCGGERDRSKRPLMGRAASRGADYVVVTSDNPRSEDPLAIISEIEAGMTTANYTVIPDRRAAIRHALEFAKPKDTVLVAGKGHEPYQVIGKQVLPFDDRLVIRELLDELAAGRN